MLDTVVAVIISMFILYLFWLYLQNQKVNMISIIPPDNSQNNKPAYVNTVSDQSRQDFDEIVYPPNPPEQIIPDYVREENDYVHANPDDPQRTDFDDVVIGPPLTIPPAESVKPPTVAEYYPISDELEKIINSVTSSTYTNQIVAQINATPTKKIAIVKDTTNSDAVKTEGWRTFQIAEIKAYSASRLLTQSDYESATYEGSDLSAWPAMNALDGDYSTFTHTIGENPRQSLILTLKEPQLLSGIDIINRADCCQERLNGALLLLLDTNNTPFYTRQLTGEQTISVVLEKPMVIAKK